MSAPCLWEDIAMPRALCQVGDNRLSTEWSCRRQDRLARLPQRVGRGGQGLRRRAAVHRARRRPRGHGGAVGEFQLSESGLAICPLGVIHAPRIECILIFLHLNFSRLFLTMMRNPLKGEMVESQVRPEPKAVAGPFYWRPPRGGFLL